MNQILKKHWTSLLGVIFVLAAFVTLFKYTIEQGWITDYMKIGFGLLSGAGLCIAGLSLSGRGQKWASPIQILMGLGACILYATFSFAGIYFGLWSPMTVLIGMTAVTAGVLLYAYRYDSRLLMNIALVGGLLSPLLMQPENDQVFTLFLYLLVINAALFFLSIVKRWSELRINAFIGTWIVYGVYYVHFNPVTDGVWSMPFRYALAAFLFYLVGFLLSSWRSNRKFAGWNLYLSLTNSVLFGCWSALILDGELKFAYIMGFIGFLHLIAAAIIYSVSRRFDVAALSYLIGGLLLVLLTSSNLGSGLAMKPIVNVFIWGALAGALALVGQAKRWAMASISSLIIWVAVGCYWFVVTWDTPRGEWFGTFIPFLNWGAMAWVLLAVIGFYYSAKGLVSDTSKESQKLLSNLFALLAHFIVGGLLTVQIQNIYIVYFDSAADQLLQLTLTISWGIYALLLFLWGAYRQQILFRWFGTVVLLIVACKALFMDLSGKEMLYKVLVLLILGGISFVITWINGKWSVEQQEDSSVSSTTDV